MVEGVESEEVIRALLRSIQDYYDYGAYQTTVGTLLGKFSAEQMIPVLLEELPDLIRRQPDWAGDIVNQIAHQARNPQDSMVRLFNDLVAQLPSGARTLIVEFVRKEEDGGWLDGREGVLCT